MALYLEGKTNVDTNELSPKEATPMSHEVKYIGMDVHKEAIVIAVLNGSGTLVMETIVETKASSILQFIHGLLGELHVTWEEGTWAAWLHDLLQPHVQEVVVGNPRRISLALLALSFLHGLSQGLSDSGSPGRVAVGSHRGHRHWHRRSWVQQGQQGRGYNLRPDQYPRPCLLGLHRRLCLHGWIKVSYAALSFATSPTCALAGLAGGDHGVQMGEVRCR
jgi:hypothetical protein